MLWLKALHLIAMVAWFSGLFYLPRLFVYHAQAADEIGRERFKVMERKLLWGITTPSAILTWVFGIATLMNIYDVKNLPAWLLIKLAFVGVLVIYHLMCIKYTKDFKADNNKHTHTYYRWFNEFPVLILLLTILLAVIKPTF